MTYQQWQTQMRTQLESVGVDSGEAHATARLALDFVTSTRYAALISPDTSMDERVEARLNTLALDLLKRRPLAYILGQAHFWGREWQVSQATLIPRPETEFLVETVLERLKNQSQPKIADLGTGSGIIAITLALELQLETVWATEISAEAREIAQANSQCFSVDLQILNGQSDWLAPIRELAPFDALVSNPPYIPSRGIEDLQSEVRDYEPRGALDGGADGLAPYRQFALGASRLLKPEGFLACEIGDGQFADIQTLFEARNWQVEAPIRDLSGHERVFVARPLRA